MTNVVLHFSDLVFFSLKEDFH